MQVTRQTGLVKPSQPSKPSKESAMSAVATPSTTRTHRPQATLKKALVTGATSGIGRAAALQLAREGFEVVVHGRDEKRGAEAVREIEKAGGKASFVAAELGSVEDVKRLAEAAGDVDVLVNNSGSAWFGTTESLDPRTYDEMFNGNVRATYFVTAAIAPRMAARGTGSIINVGSVAGSVGLAGGAAYSATKAALHAFTRAWAAEYSPRGVRVNAVAPGPVHTAIVPRDRTDAIGETTLLKRAAEASEIAEVIAFLASPKSSYITGAIVAADAGRGAI
jgi:NAD(P)-dependent dehydrogenase (short-subunit alcohol dehydrogenase family)